MTDKIFSPDIRRKNAQGGRLVLYSILGLLAISVVLISFILTDVNRKYLNSQEQASNFAHHITLMCRTEIVDDRYKPFCKEARVYLDNPVDDQSQGTISLTDIARVDCLDDKLVLHYTNGKTEKIKTTCQ